MIKKERKGTINLEKFLSSLHNKGGLIEYLSGYKNFSKDKAEFNCKKHGVYKSIPRIVLIRDGHGCPDCTELCRRKPVCGVGINDVLGYEILDYYLWYNIIRRSSVTEGCYKDVTFHKDWILFSNFLKDLPEIDNFKMKKIAGWQLDKDLLSGKDKIYSKETVCFLPDEINSCLATGKGGKVGVAFDYEIGKYFALVTLNGKRRRFGSFETQSEAHDKYKEVKLIEIKRLAEKYKGDITEKCYNALLNWEHY